MPEPLKKTAGKSSPVERQARQDLLKKALSFDSGREGVGGISVFAGMVGFRV